MKNAERRFPFYKLLIFPLIALYYLVAHLVDTTCLIKHFTGVPCPGCGMTRALLSAARLDFAAAFSYHPLFFTVPLLFLYFFFDGKLFGKKSIDYAVMISMGTAFLALWIIRLF